MKKALVVGGDHRYSRGDHVTGVDGVFDYALVTNMQRCCARRGVEKSQKVELGTESGQRCT
jgi:hypothetical protein